MLTRFIWLELIAGDTTTFTNMHFCDTLRAVAAANGTMPVFERPPVESVQVDDLVPEPLPEAVLKELGPVISVIGKYRLECLYSKHWQLRDKTLQQLEKDMLQNRLNGDTFSAFRCLKLSPTAESNTLLKRTGSSCCMKSFAERVGTVCKRGGLSVDTAISTSVCYCPVLRLLLMIWSRAINKVTLRALGDKVSNVFHTSLQV